MAAAFVVTIFTSSALLFFVQPIFTKMVLPHLGGAPAVWTTAMLFFQSALLLGYAWAHFISTRLAIRAQIACQAALWGLGLVFLPIGLPEAWRFDGAGHPAAQTLLVFAMGVGIPFVALAANAPLLQKWYARTGGQAADDPYHLYAASNAGSLIALLAFPLVAEPLLGTDATARYWSSGYLILGLGLAACALAAADGSHTYDARTAKLHRYRPSPREVASWIGWAFVPSSMMLGVTSTMSTDLGAFPLLWVVPLALYLLSFVMAFSARLRPPQAVVLVLFLTSTTLSIALLATNLLAGLGLISFGLLLLAYVSVALLFHIRLHDSRPPESALTPFYFAMAIGGALGGLFNSLLAPLLFDHAVEVVAVFALTGLALQGPRGFFHDSLAAIVAVLVFAAVAALLWALDLSFSDDAKSRLFFCLCITVILLLSRSRPWRFTLTAAGFLAAGTWLFGDAGVIHRERSFFGTYVVQDRADGMRQLRHGTTQHGLQFIDDIEKKPRILSYYHPRSPLGQIFTSPIAADAQHIGVIGLGIGALACYRRPDQHWRFYEIDRIVDRIARNPAFFSYMDQCAGDAPTIFGDARINLAHEADLVPYDVLVVDAYSSDAIPVHLMTIEALDLYFSRLAPDGLLALHISNRFYDLEPLLGAAAGAVGATAVTRISGDRPLAVGEAGSAVVVMAQDRAVLAPFSRAEGWRPAASGNGRVWSDDHASVLDALRSMR